MNRFMQRNLMVKLSLYLTCIMFFLTPALSGQLPITLQKALEIAETGSPNVQRSLLTVEQFQHNLNAERASLKSRFSLTLEPYSFSNNRIFDNQFSQWFTNTETFSRGTFQVEQPILQTGGSVGLFNTFGWRNNRSAIANFSENSNKAFFNNLYLAINQPLFTYNRRQMALDELSLSYENANLEYAIQRLTLEKTITSQFFDVYLAQLNLDISRDELANTSQNYEIVKIKVEANLLAREELYQAELNFANAQLSVQDSELSLANTKELFKREIGMSLDEDIRLISELDVQEVMVDLDRAIDLALNSRLELRQRRIDIEKSFFELTRTKALNEFRADVQLTLGIFGDNESFGDVYSSPTSNPSIGISMNIPIWDWGERNQRVQAVEVSMKSQQLDLREEEKQIALDIRRVYRSIQTQMPRIEIARKNVENAERTYEINLERYRNGDLSGIDLNQFQTQLSNKKIDLARALINYKNQLLDLKILTLYDWEKQEPVALALLKN
ncbi:TolC family protein [Portibacter marinus]|uniref:TolC family protein n=1 Tax=Portibacter marinus TaxID=2898660 RepID=UPI001F3083DE|nr:TolC family protein [Portibacter marinus]